MAKGAAALAVAAGLLGAMRPAAAAPPDFGEFSVFGETQDFIPNSDIAEYGAFTSGAFGGVGVGEARRVRFYLKNFNAALPISFWARTTISATDFTSGSEDFSIVPEVGSATLAAQTSAPITIEFRPTARATRSAFLTFFYRSGGGPLRNYKIAMTGIGISRGQARRSFDSRIVALADMSVQRNPLYSVITGKAVIENLGPAKSRATELRVGIAEVPIILGVSGFIGEPVPVGPLPKPKRGAEEGTRQTVGFTVAVPALLPSPAYVLIYVDANPGEKLQGQDNRQLNNLYWFPYNIP